ncbi:TonB-dependent receptor [Phenylobacterium montanum]|uniref:TonB-dependent receptor n=1 Tax=Phenylobacterium montanum TaxID=2823693 RepID=A0A975G239_9CAUL|nr:TonB-dependent receptor [Caulobacter sp. S6]QUD89152.1 TonB-dependent receptor [Caulobacter sp. S6]
MLVRDLKAALLAGAMGAALAAPLAAYAQEAAAPRQADSPVTDIVVTAARRLSEARASIQPQVGASTYTIDSKAIQALPGGDNVSMNQVVLQAPGVAQDSYGQLHIRGEHNGLQFRLNGVILPEGLSVFSQALSPRLADKIQLITGALPAEYGLRTAGIVDITTKSMFDNSGQASVYGGSHDQVQPSVDYGGSSGSLNYFVSLGYLHNDLGVESPDGRSNPLHDRTDQFQGFGYLEDTIDPETRVSLIAGSSIQRFQIPDVAGETSTFTLPSGQAINVDGQTAYPSDRLNENQREVTHYLIGSYLHTTDRFTGQLSLFARYSTLSFAPDVLGDLIYNGIAQTAAKSDTAGGLQAEGVYHLTEAHTLRGGVIVEIDRSTSQTSSQVIPLAEDGGQASQTPETIIDNGAKTSGTYSVYLQDEWKLLQDLTLNYGLRFDQFDGYRDENQVSPRANLVWLPLEHTTVHIGYARYFTPPPFELVAAETIGKFAGTTGQAGAGLDTTPYAERADYYDVGVEQTVIRGLTVGLDTYYKRSRHLIDEGQFGAPIILTPFNYDRGVQYGVEFSSAYQHGPLSAYFNLAYGHAQGRDIVSSQFNFAPDELAYIKTHYIYLDHDQKFTGSAGVSYLWRGTRMSADLIYGSGLRAEGAAPNGRELSPYTTVNLGLSHRFKDAPLGPVELRLDVVNLFDKKYEIRDGTGVGVGAPQFGARRGIFGGITKEF